MVKKAHCMLGTVGEGTEEGAAGSQEPVLQRCPLSPTPPEAAAFGHRCRQAAGLSIAELPWALPLFAQPPAPGTALSPHTSPVCAVSQLLAGEVGWSPLAHPDSLPFQGFCSWLISIYQMK